MVERRRKDVRYFSSHSSLFHRKVRRRSFCSGWAVQWQMIIKRKRVENYQELAELPICLLKSSLENAAIQLKRSWGRAGWEEEGQE